MLYFYMNKSIFWDIHRPLFTKTTWLSKIVWNFQGSIFGHWKVVCTGSRAEKLTKKVRNVRNNVMYFFEPWFLGRFLGHCLDHNSAPLRSFETKKKTSEAEFRGAGRDIGPGLWILNFYIKNMEIRVNKSDVLVFFSDFFRSLFRKNEKF